MAKLEFRCQDVGVVCGRKVTADTEEELIGAIAEHAEEKHGVALNETLIDYARTKVRGGSE